MSNNRLVPLKDVKGDYICTRCSVYMRAIGGNTHRDVHNRHLYSRQFICDLCGQTVQNSTDLDRPFINEAIVVAGVLRTHFQESTTGKLLACAKDGGYLYEDERPKGTIGKRCPRCDKFRDRVVDQEWQEPPKSYEKTVVIE